MGMLEGESNENTEQKKGILQTWEFWIMIIAIAIIVLGNQRFGNFLMDRAVFAGTLIIISLTLMKGAQYYFKQISPQVIWEGGHNSHTGRVYQIGGFGAIKLGGVTFPVNLEGKDGTLLFPITAITATGTNKAVMIRATKYDVNSLPVNMKIEMLQQKFPEPYLFGLASEIQMLDQGKIPNTLGEPRLVTIGEVEQLYKQQNEILSDYEKLSKERGKPAEIIVSDMSRLATKASRPTRFRDLGKKLGVTEEEEK